MNARPRNRREAERYLDAANKNYVKARREKNQDDMTKYSTEIKELHDWLGEHGRD